MKQKKKKVVDNKFNFDDEYIIGVSGSASSVEQKKAKKKKKKKNKKIDKNKAPKSTNKRIQMNEKKRRAQKRIIKTAVCICLLVGAGCFLCLSPMFDVQEIVVEDNKIIPADTIRSLSQIELYKNIFLLNKSEVIDHIEKNPYVNSVKVSRVLPDKIKIKVEERTEKYLLQFAEGKYAILDGQGYVLSVTSELKNLHVITGAETNIEELVKITSNQNRLCENDLKKLDKVANIIETSKNYEVDTFITKIDISEENNIKLVLKGEGKIVYLGSCTDLNTRILYMKEILNAEKGKNGEMFIDGNLSEDHVFFRENV